MHRLPVTLVTALIALLPGGVRAGETSFASQPVDIPLGSRLAIGITNSCNASADYRVRVHLGDGALVLSRDGALSANGDAAFAYTPDKAVAGVVVTVRLSCAEGTPKPWLSYIVQQAGGAVTKPRLGPLRAPLGAPGEPQEGTGI